MREGTLTYLFLLLTQLFMAVGTSAGDNVLKTSLSGNLTISERILRKRLPVISVQDSGLLDSIDTAISRIRTSYFSRGYLDVEITHQLKGDSLFLLISEGPQYKIEEIRFIGNSFIPSDMLQRVLVSKKGRGLDLSTLGEDDFNLMLHYADYGFIYAEVEHEVTYAKDHRAVLTFHINEGRKVTVARIDIAGNARTSVGMIAREMSLRPGSPFSRQLLFKSQMQLMNTDLYKSVAVTPGAIDPDSNSITIEVEVEEKPLRAFAAGLGYGSGDAFRLTASWAHRNLFGQGSRLELNLLNSFQIWEGYRLVRGRTQVGYREPWLWNTATPLEIIMYYDDFRPPYTDYRLQTVGTSIELSKRLGGYSNIGWRWNQEWLKMSPGWRNQGATAETLSYRGRRSIITFTDYQKFDDPVNPRRGLSFDGEVQYTGGVLGGAETFQRLTAEGKFHYKNSSFALGASGRVKLGVIGDWNLKFNAPLYEKYFLGGPFSIRGYANGRFGETDLAGNNIGGNKMGLLNIELKAYLPKHWVLVIFSDAALLENCTFRQLTIRKWKSSPGLGLRYLYPFGTGRLDFAFPTSRWDEIKYWKVVVAWGETF